MSQEQSSAPGEAPVGGAERRAVLGRVATAAMLGGVAVSYGACAAMGARYLYPARSRPMRWQYVADLGRFPVGTSRVYRAPTGERITIARQAESPAAESFVALSSTCPHLGCQVHWEGHNDRFFCPCHNGVFDPDGNAVSGPPAEAGQDLPRFALRVEGGLLYVEVPATGLARADSAGGHDPCLDPRRDERGRPA